VLDTQQNTCLVRGHEVSQEVRGCLRDRVLPHQPCVVYETVDLAADIERDPNNLLPTFFTSDVMRHKSGCAAELSLDGAAKAFSTTAENNLAAFRHEAANNGLTQAAGSASDDGDSVLESPSPATHGPGLRGH
jgi:hypothetical protein